MRSIISLISGIVIIVGAAFVSWLSIDETGGDDRVSRFFGREVFGGDVALIDTTGPFLTLVGGILITAFALAALILIIVNSRSHGIFVFLSFCTRIAALLAIAGVALYLTDFGDIERDLEVYYRELWDSDGANAISEEGVFICLAGAIVGFISGVPSPFSVWNTLFRRGRDDDMEQAPLDSTEQRREEYYAGGDSDNGLSLRQDYYENLKQDAGVLPGTPEEHYRRAVGHEANGEYDQAIAEYDAAISGDPNFAVAHSHRGSLHLVLGNRLKALYDFEKTAQISDDPNLVEMAQSRIEELDEQASEGNI